MFGLELVVGPEEEVELIELEGDDGAFEEVRDAALLELESVEGLFELVLDELEELVGATPLELD